MYWHGPFMDDAVAARSRYRAVIISPHLDDAVFSCAGAIADLVNEGPVLVLNLFTRYLSDLKMHGAVLGEERYQEELEAARYLGFESRNLGELDAPFRRDAYRKLGNIFRPPVQEDIDWLPSLRDRVFAILNEIDFDRIFVPLGVGWHVDHVVTHLLFDGWAEGAELLYYEDASYCCIPHATRYRLNDVAVYRRSPADKTLAPINEVRAWWQAAMYYADTALMKNLRPWVVRQLAVPVVGFYLYRLMAAHRGQVGVHRKMRLKSLVKSIDQHVDQKVAAMSLYGSQFKEFFTSREDCIATLYGYANRMQIDIGPVERYWVALEEAKELPNVDDLSSADPDANVGKYYREPT